MNLERANYTTYLINDLYYISIPKDWIFIEDDRFRAESKNGNTLLTVSNYQYENIDRNKKAHTFLEELMLPMFEIFETEDGYIPLDIFENKADYILKSYKVDDETQYILATARFFYNSLIVTTLQVHDIEEYNIELKNLLKTIFQSIQYVS